jgi:hypothetical protein
MRCSKLFTNSFSVSNFVSCCVDVRAIGSEVYNYLDLFAEITYESQSAWISSGTLRTDFKMIASLLELYKCIT